MVVTRSMQTNMAEGDGNDQTDEVPPQGGSAAGGSPQVESEALILRRMELEFQERREKAEREAAERKEERAREAEERKEERARESEERMLKLKLESEERLRKLELETRAGTQTPAGSDSDEGRRPGLDPVTQCAKVLKGLKLPCKADIPLWFDEVERLFVTYGVPESSRVHLVVQALSERVRYMLRGLGDSECNDYEVVKKAVLQELRLSPAEYLDRFAKAAKRNDETWSQFASRVGTQFDYYLKSRKVETKEEVVALMVADRIKNSLSAEGLEYVRLREAETWLKPPEIANVLQTFEQAKGRGSAVGRRDQVPPRNTNSGKRMWTCSVCKGEGQYFRLCPKIAEKPGNPGRSAHVQRVIVEDASAGQAQDAGLTSGGQRILVAEVNALGSIDELRKSRLQHVELDCAGKTITTTVDTGSEVTVVRESLVPQDAMQPSGTIRLVPAFGESVSARVVSLPVSLRQAVSVVGSPKVQLICAVTNNLAEGLDCLLSREDWELLTKCHPNREANSTAETFVRSNGDREVGTGAISEPAAAVCEITGETAPDAPAEEIDEAVEVEGPRARLLASQLADDSLKKAWADAKRGKAGMFVSDGLLFHRDTIAGAKVTQLVLPSERREEVLLLAHESLWGGHLGLKKTKARIKYSFFWPGLEADVSHHCQTCHGCQIRADRRLSDRVPIVPLTRPDHPFQVVNVDIIGPLDVPSGRGHKYALCLVDLCTRWPEVVCLRSLTAKATCEALLTIFSRTGIPELICSDQGTTFTFQLTQSFLERLGCAPRFSSPEHPESNGTVERWNRVLKNMLFHVIEKDPRNWDRLVPFVLWAYREVPHDTTGVAPFRMLYGRNPTGLLAILQHSWTGELPVPGTLKEEPAKYLRQLREQLEEEHLRHVDTILGLLTDARLKASVEKCQVAQGHIKYLSHVVGSGTHGPDPEKLAAIRGLVQPQTKKELRSLLGLCGYYREYVNNYAEVAEPLTSLTKRGVPNPIPWSSEAERAFEQLKEFLCSAAALNTPDPHQPYWLFTDASEAVAGACLAQMGEAGREKPIAFASHRFTPTQTRWSTIEREAFAIIWELKKFDYWVFGAEVNVVSDHNPLSYLTTCTPHGAKLSRWALALQRYNVVVSHRKGANNANADALSRLHNVAWGGHH
ncbi:LOW QUALITY PROTEIN: uncharacterized protein LOC144168174 [Haemaphysalis longicornis]